MVLVRLTGEAAMPVGERHQSELLEELKEFASFTPAEQRYIRCSLEVALASADAADKANQ